MSASRLPSQGGPRGIHYCLETEQAVIGYFIFCPEAFESHGIRLSPDSFFCPGPRAIFEAMNEVLVEGEALALDTVARRLESYDLSALADAMATCPLDWLFFFMAYVHLRSLASTRRRLHAGVAA
jgi:hypothetical protein